MNSQQNKDLITRYNADVIERGNMELFTSTVTISLVDIFTIEDGLLLEHWGENNFPMVIQSLAS